MNKGYSNPYPTNSDIIKMALRNLEINDGVNIEELYENIKNNLKYNVLM